ncbi:MAG: hypothetical protein FK730_01560 [Asgard group archaeon]|nr:hypothetical protein [Asgard group archaeon]
MNSTTMRNIINDKDDQKIIRHSKYRKIIELLILLVFSIIGIGAIVVGSIFNEQSYFFRIALIIIGIVIVILFFESFLTILTNQIILTSKEIKFRKYFSWKVILWDEITSLEMTKRSTRFKKEVFKPRFVNLIFNTKTKEPIYYSLIRFRTNEAFMIVEIIKEQYQKVKNKTLVELNTTDFNKKSEPISEHDISKQIPPKVEDFELDDD